MRERERELNKICEALRKLSENDASVKKYADIFERMLNKVEWKKVKDICEIVWWKDYKHLNEWEYPVYWSWWIMTYVDKFVYDKPTVLLPRKWSISNVFYVNKPFWNVDTIYYTKINTDIINPKYLYHYITNIHIERLNTSNAARPALTRQVLDNIDVPIPSLEEQEKIVNILDKFEKLVNDISEWLPAEIELRKKQYEYYRDKLLTFN